MGGVSLLPMKVCSSRSERLSKISAPPQLLSELTQMFIATPSSHELVASEFTYVANERLRSEDLEEESRERIQMLIKNLLEDEDCVLVHTNIHPFV